MKPVIIGNAELWLGDCRDVLPMLGKVDAVVDKSDAVVFNQQHDKSAKRQHCAPTKSNGTVATPQGGNSGTIRDGGLFTGADGEAIRGDASGLSEGFSAVRDCTEVEGRTGKANGRFKDGTQSTAYRSMVDKTHCNRCGSTEMLVVHHRDNVHTNNTPDNMEVLCSPCHTSHHKQEWWAARKASA